MAPEKANTVVDALIAHAARDGLGEDVSWAQVEAAISDLLGSPTAASNLRQRISKINDPEAALTLADWFDQASDGRDKDALDAARPAEKIFAPVQGVGFAGVATALFFAATGALALPAGVIIGAGAMGLAGVATYGRWRLSKREDEARSEAKALRRLAAIAHKPAP